MRLRCAVPAAVLLACLPLGWSARAERPAAARPPRLSAHDATVNALLAQMTLDEKIGQMTQAEQHQLKDEQRRRDLLPGLAALGRGLRSADQQPSGLDGPVRALAGTDRAQTRLKIPIIYGVDAVHGHNNVIGAVVFPHNIGLGATRNAALVEEIGRITAREVRATGIHWTFAPCVAVARDERWGRTYEGFAEDPKLVAELGAAAVRGLQGTDLSDPQRVLACAKHFVGDGGTVWGTGTSAEALRAPLPARPGRHPADRGRAAPPPPAGLPDRDRGGRRLHHAVLQQLERREVLGQQAAAHGDPEGGAGLRGLPHLRLQRHRRAAGRLTAPTSSSRSTPAWTW